MEDQFKNLKAPKRNNQTIENSFLQIQLKAKKHSSKLKILNFSIVISAIAIFFILIISSSQLNLLDMKNANTEDEIVSVEAIPGNYDINQFYLIGRKYLLPPEIKDRFSKYVHEIKQQPPTRDPINGVSFQVTYKNGLTEQYAIYDPFTSEGLKFTLTNKETIQSIEISYSEYMELSFLHPLSSNYIQDKLDISNFIRDTIKIVLIIFIYSGYLVLAKKVSPLAREPLKFEFTLKNMVIKLSFLFFVLTIISWKSYVVLNLYNWVEALIWFSILFLGRKLKDILDGDRRRNWREIPLSIFFYFLCFLIYVY